MRSTDHYRPRFHFTPARNWMNDPNGLVYFDGTYHLFFQYNPDGEDWGNMSWGHATSDDFVTWTEHPVAIPCTLDEQVYSGSVVVDHENTSGFGGGVTPPLVAVYTSVFADGRQAQSLAVSLDGGYAWDRYPGNPVLDRGSTAFRDPKVFRAADREGHERWIMVAVEAERRQVLVYSSTNLREWTFESTIGPFGPDGVVWECPDLFPLDVDGDPLRQRWVLILSTNHADLSDASATAYVVGDFDGHTFTPEPPETWRLLDQGSDFYAAVSFDNVPDRRRIVIGWGSNWQYAAHIPTRPWRGLMSLPRELGLTTRDGVATLTQSTPVETTALGASDGAVEASWRYGPTPLDETFSFRAGRHYRLDIEWEINDATSVGIDLLSGPDGRTRLRYDTVSSELTLDRSQSGQVDFHPDFATVSSASAPLVDGSLALQVFVDGSIIELLADDGAVTITDQVFPGHDADEAVFFAEGGRPSVTFEYFPARINENEPTLPAAVLRHAG